MHFALSCKALLRQYRQDEAAWLSSLHVSLACSGSGEDVAACDHRLQRLLQRLPPGSIASLSLEQSGSPFFAADLLGLLRPVSQQLTQLELHIADNVCKPQEVELDLPLLRSATLSSNGRLRRYAYSWSFARAPLLEALRLRDAVLLQLPLAAPVTRLDLDSVDVHEHAATHLLACEPGVWFGDVARL